MSLPDLLTILRMILTPLLFFILALPFENACQSWINYFAALLFSLAALSDFFDGFIVRKWGQIAKLGVILDPLTDKMLILAAFLGLLLLDRINEWMIYPILMHGFFITGFRVIMVSENLDVSTSFAGRLKTGFQITTIIFLVLGWIFGDILLYIALALTLYSGFGYVYHYIKHRKER